MSITSAAAPKELDIEGENLIARLQRLLHSPSWRPPLLPAAAVELMPLAQRPNVAFGEVVKVLEKDPVLAARVLSIAQSAFYASRSPVMSLHQALVRLGLTALRDLVLEASLHLKVFRVPGFEAPMERLARHSTVTAHVARVVCRRTRVEGEYAFLCGLLHDVGFAALLHALGEDAALRRTPFDVLVPALDEAHVEASALLTRLWKLPEPLQRLVATHHDVTVNGRAQPANAALIVAEQLAWEAGAGMLPPPPDADPLSLVTPEPPLKGLDANWTGVVAEARRVLQMDELAMGAARAEAFEIARQLGAAAQPAKVGARA